MSTFNPHRHTDILSEISETEQRSEADQHYRAVHRQRIMDEIKLAAAQLFQHHNHI